MNSQTRFEILTVYGDLIYLYKKSKIIKPSTKIILTPPLCEDIVNLQIFPKTLRELFIQSSAVSVQVVEFLRIILSPNPPIKRKGTFLIECQKNFFYEFLIILSEYFDIDFKAIEQMKCFSIKDKDFSYGAFKTFKSRNKGRKPSIPALQALLLRS